jgi:hypothetical protein
MALLPIDLGVDLHLQTGAVMEFQHNTILVGKKTGGGFNITISFSSRKIVDMEGEFVDARWCCPSGTGEGNNDIDEEFKNVFDVIDGSSKWIGSTTYYFEITEEDFDDESNKLDEDIIIDKLINFDTSNFVEYDDTFWTPSAAKFLYGSPYLKGSELLQPTKMNIAQLKNALYSREIDKHGLKPELVKRLSEALENEQSYFTKN